MTLQDLSTTPIEVIGIRGTYFGCSGGHLLRKESLVRFRQVQCSFPFHTEVVSFVYLVSNGIDQNQVGLLIRPTCLKYSDILNGQVAQVVEFYKDSNDPKKLALDKQFTGICRVVLLNSTCSHQNTTTNKKLTTNNNLSDKTSSILNVNK